MEEGFEQVDAVLHVVIHLIKFGVVDGLQRAVARHDDPRALLPVGNCLL